MLALKARPMLRHDYAPLFLPQMEEAMAEARTTAALKVDELDLAATRDGDQAKVELRTLAVSGTIEGEAARFRVSGDCVEFAVGGQEMSGCGEELRELVPFVPAELFGKQAKTGFVAVERDGAWFVSPTRTVLRVFVDALRALDRENLDALRQAVEGFLTGMGGSAGVAPGAELGGYSPEEFSELPPAEQERIIREELERQRSGEGSPGGDY
jgi:hypothetical protein